MNNLSPSEAELKVEIISILASEFMACSPEIVTLTRQLLDVSLRYSKALALAVIGEDEDTHYVRVTSGRPHYIQKRAIRNSLRASQRQLLGQEGES